jgi:S1-C subfamily serine protease
VKIGLVHLDGPHRGWAQVVRGTAFRIGADPSCEVHLEGAGGIAPVHARVEVEEGEVYFRPTGAALLNRKPVHEARLRHGDLLTLGDSVGLRVLLLPEGVSLPSPRPSRIHLPKAALLAAVLALALGGWQLWRVRHREAELEKTIEAEQRLTSAVLAAQKRGYEGRIAELQTEFSELVERTALRSEVEERVGEVHGRVERAVAGVESSVREQVSSEVERALKEDPGLRAAREAAQRLRDSDEAAERIIAQVAPSVCLVQGAYGFGRMKEGRWVFLKEAPEGKPSDVATDGEEIRLSLSGDGPVYQVEYTGTGFLVDAGGIVATNRHIAEPWWRNESVASLLRDGYEARFLYLRAFFPGRSQAIPCDRTRTIVSEEADVALIALAEVADLPAPIVVRHDARVAIGRRVLLLGYPSGIHALLAKSDEGLTDAILAGGEFDPSDVLDTLAARDSIRPIPTQGHIGDLMKDKVLYDAATAVGGSGGPVLNLDGEVVAINYGILMSFRAANFGVPVEFLHRLMGQLGRPQKGEAPEATIR